METYWELTKDSKAQKDFRSKTVSWIMINIV